MDKKKLIGTIIGVVFFIILIAGATFAWLTFSANVTNGTYNGTSLNFTYTLGTGTNVSNIKMLSSTPARNAITAGSGYVALTASKPAGTAKASRFDLKLSKTTNGITAANVFKYAVCRSATATDCNNTVSTAIPSSASGNWVAVGTVSTGTSEQVLYSDTTSFAAEGAASANYYVYMWIDGSAITSSNQANVIGKSFSGNIYGYSVQTD